MLKKVTKGIKKCLNRFTLLHAAALVVALAFILSSITYALTVQQVPSDYCIPNGIGQLICHK